MKKISIYTGSELASECAKVKNFERPSIIEEISENFIKNWSYSNNKVAIINGLPSTGKKTCLRMLASITERPAILHINTSDLVLADLTMVYETLKNQGLKNFFIENITEIPDFIKNFLEYSRAFACTNSFVITGDSPYSFYVGTWGPLLNARFYETENFYLKNVNIEYYIKKAIFKNIETGIKNRKYSDISYEFEYILSLYEDNTLRYELEKIMRNDYSTFSELEIKYLRQTLCHARVFKGYGSNPYEFSCDSIKDYYIRKPKIRKILPEI